MSVFFTSDLHFGHKNCLKYDKRDFPTIEAHDEALIERWNSVVGNRDDVWVLGDISWRSPDETVEIFRRLKGTKHLCIGNHDKPLLRDRYVRRLFSEIVEYKEIYLRNNRGIVLCHYPILSYRNQFHGWHHLYGHVHVTFQWDVVKEVQEKTRTIYRKPSNMFNVGCMVPGMDYTPKTLEQILAVYGESLE